MATLQKMFKQFKPKSLNFIIKKAVLYSFVMTDIVGGIIGIVVVVIVIILVVWLFYATVKLVDHSHVIIIERFGKFSVYY